MGIIARKKSHLGSETMTFFFLIIFYLKIKCTDDISQLKNKHNMNFFDIIQSLLVTYKSSHITLGMSLKRATKKWENPLFWLKIYKKLC